MRIVYSETPEFQRDLKKLQKRFRSLSEDLEFAKIATIELYHLKKLDNLSIVQIPAFSSNEATFYKIRKFACKSLKNRGAQSSIRIVYAFSPEHFGVEFIEIYFKGDREMEDKGRIRSYLKEIQSKGS